MPRTKKIAIIAGYLARETHGLLGPQMAATIIRENTPYDCIVIGVTREDDNARVKSALADYFGGQRPMVVGFSSLSGGEKLFSLARELKQEGCLTILAGPQAGLDYVGETDWRSHPHRFRGLSDNFSLALQGPAEQIIPLLTGPGSVSPRPGPGILCPGENGEIIRTPPKAWDEAFLGRVDWGNLFILENGALAPHAVDAAQVLQQIGCPHASRRVPVEVDYPVSIDKKKRRKIRFQINGCSFCDVAVDKGFYGALAMETVLKQIEGLPETGSGAKIPFELINENPLGGLPRLLREIRDRGIRITRINLTMRADWLPPGEKRLREALALAVPMGACIVLTSMGFESFDDDILRNLNKGATVEDNLKAVRVMRRLKEEFPEQWGYLREEGGVHGFIHPTPWDDPAVEANLGKIISRHGLEADILPSHSTPLIIHHGSALGDWIRAIEEKENVRFTRYGSIIGWWEVGGEWML